MLKKLSIYEFPMLVQSAELEAWAFQELKDKPDEGLKVVRSFRDGAENLFKDFDKRWIALCDGDIHELSEWASRMRFILGQLDEIDRNLAVSGTRLFDWNKVCLAMGYVNSFRVAVEQILDHSERDASA